MAPTCRAPTSRVLTCRAPTSGRDLQGANLWGARNLTQEQLDGANGDDRTMLPEGLTRPAHWSRSEGNEGQSGTAQPGSD